MIDPSSEQVSAVLEYGFDGGGVKQSVLFRYDRSDPLSIQAVFDDDNVWTFGRELLIEALEGTRIAGLADVQAWVSADGGCLVVHLTSHAGENTIWFRKTQVKKFLKATEAIVPRAREADELEMDRHIAELLDSYPD